jgi:hypothetical protein
MKIFVMSLDTEIGEKRRKRLNYDYEIIWGIDKLEDVPEWIKNKTLIRYNVKDKETLLRKKASHLYTYYKILEKIVDEKLNNVVICEDDAIMTDKKYLDTLLLDYKENDAVLLNGKLHHPKTYKKDKLFNENDIHFQNGINKIDYERYRWSCCACIYYPTWESAQKLMACIIKSKSLTYLDLFLSKNKIIKNYIIHLHLLLMMKEFLK